MISKNKLQTKYSYYQPEVKSMLFQYRKEANLAVIKGWSTNGRKYASDFETFFDDIISHFGNSRPLRVFFKMGIFDPFIARYLFRTVKLLNLYHSKGVPIKLIWFVGSFENGIYQSGQELSGLSEFDFQIALT